MGDETDGRQIVFYAEAFDQNDDAGVYSKIRASTWGSGMKRKSEPVSLKTVRSCQHVFACRHPRLTTKSKSRDGKQASGMETLME